VTEVSKGTPLLVITPYGTSPTEIMEILIESLQRAQIQSMIYTDKKYDIDVPVYNNNNGGIIFMTDVMDYMKYSPNIIPIYIVEWGIREHNINRYSGWIGGIFESIYPEFIQENIPPNIISNVIRDHDITEIFRDIKYPAVIYGHYHTLNNISKLIRSMCVNVYWSENPRDKIIFNKMKNGILMAENSESIVDVPTNIPVYIFNLDSDNGMGLFMYPHCHGTLYIYIENITQYILLSQGISDANLVYKSLINNSRRIYTDKYNNLYVR
jgi:hypothetical protein